MKLTRAAMTVAAVALTPTLLLAGPAFAGNSGGAATTSVTGASTPAGGEMSDEDAKVAILRIIADPSTGRGVNDAAQAALNGTAQDRRYFLETGRWAAQDEDDRVAVFRILAVAQTNNDRAVVQAATDALKAGTPEAVRAFLTTGYRLAQYEDDRVATFRILGVAQTNKDRAVVQAATDALKAGTPEAVRAFRTTGYRLAQAEDDRVAVFRILADPNISDRLRTAARQALDNGTPEALRYFLEHGRYEV
ncbi:ALF repeat-containing protein [Embleya sp. AB8]|uniref:ALF repeat-containing protein n=1 Tax=Embleya sp. AB8 TaxID=3156304 RepID=UPI003C708DD9